jgi:hypothetical protein
MKKVIAEFIPIILIVFFALFTRQMIEQSHTVLGKFIAICIIVFYSSMDVLLGLLACAVFIIYYQKLFAMNQYTENMDNYCNPPSSKTEKKVTILNNNRGWIYHPDSIEAANIGSSLYDEKCLVDMEPLSLV